MVVEEHAEFLVFLGYLASYHLDLGRGFDALDLDESQAVFELLDVFSASCTGAPLVLPYSGEVCLLLYCG